MANRQWLLARHPEGALTRDCFTLQSAPDRFGQGAAGEVLMQWELLLCAPTIRNWISGKADAWHPVSPLGGPVLAPAIGQIIESNHPDFSVGQRLFGAGSWQDQQWIDPAAGYSPIANDVSSVDAMGVYGINALTAWVGLIEVGQALLGRGGCPVLIKKRSSRSQERDNNDGDDHQNYRGDDPSGTQNQRSLPFSVLGPRRFRARVGTLSRRGRIRASSSEQARHD